MNWIDESANVDFLKFFIILHYSNEKFLAKICIYFGHIRLLYALFSRKSRPIYNLTFNYYSYDILLNFNNIYQKLTPQRSFCRHLGASVMLFRRYILNQYFHFALDSLRSFIGLCKRNKLMKPLQYKLDLITLSELFSMTARLQNIKRKIKFVAF